MNFLLIQVELIVVSLQKACMCLTDTVLVQSF